MNKIIRFVTRHMVGSALSVIFSFLAIVSSVYGFSQIAGITSVATLIPEVKSVDELTKSSRIVDPTPTIAVKPDSLVPSLTTDTTSTPLQVVPSIMQNNKTVSVTPSFEKDEETEDVAEEDRREVHIEEGGKSDDK